MENNAPRTFKFTSVADIDHDADIAQQKAKFPGSLYGDARALWRGLGESFEAALADGSEEAIQRIITANPYLLQYVTPNSGHHGIWVFPKQMIRLKAANGTPGLIPDYLAVAANSLGYKWHIIELKRASVQFSKRNGSGYTRDADEGIAQCARYRAHFADYIETVRSNIGIPDAITPESVMLMIGDAARETETERGCRADFDKLTATMSVISYDRIRRGLADDLRQRTDFSAIG